LPYLLLVVLSLLWGSSFLLIAIAAHGFDATSLALARVTIGALGLWGIALARERRWPKGAGLWLRLAAMSAFGQAIPFLLLSAAVRQTTSGDLALMMGAAPIFAFVFARLIGEGEAWTWSAALGLGLGLTGVAIAVSGPGAHGASNFTGRAEGLAAAACYAFGATLSRGASRKVGPATAAAVSMTISSCLLSALWLANNGSLSASARIPEGALAAVVALGIFNTAFAYYLYFALVVRSGATFAALNNYAVPFVGLLLGAAFLNEPIALTAWAGLALVIAGIALTGRARTPAAIAARAG
jgi:drug/metabolite transporter (DMT)-like permease